MPPAGSDRAEVGFLSAGTLQQVFEASPSAMLLVDASGRIALANSQACRLFGYLRDELIGASVEALVPPRFRVEHPDHRRSYFAAPVVRAMGEGRDLYGLRKDSSEVPIEIGLNPIRTEAGLCALAAIVDITARKRSEDMLRASLREKEMLLREIHHRVKNNMQVVSSLLSLQMNKVEDLRHRELFEECQTRVRTMALIHEKLYSTGNLASLDGSEFVRELVQMLARSYLPAQAAVQLIVEVVPLVIDVQVAIPIGLILHELITNALKHAFPDGRGGKLSILLRDLGNGRARLAVEDDGCGLPDDLEVDRSRGLGFRMVRSLVRQIDGQLVIERQAGTSFAVDFDCHLHPAAVLEPTR